VKTVKNSGERTWTWRQTGWDEFLLQCHWVTTLACHFTPQCLVSS
jgi:hypothetical protein